MWRIQPYKLLMQQTILEEDKVKLAAFCEDLTTWLEKNTLDS
jgi:hypothetical protein